MFPQPLTLVFLCSYWIYIKLAHCRESTSSWSYSITMTFLTYIPLSPQLPNCLKSRIQICPLQPLYPGLFKIMAMVKSTSSTLRFVYFICMYLNVKK